MLTIPRIEGALCAQVDPELFFPHPSATQRDVDAAKLVCDRCPARQECLLWALQHREREGIWGGMTTRERDKLGRRWCKVCEAEYRTKDRGRAQTCSKACERVNRGNTNQDTEHGTAPGYRWHKRHNQEPCIPCRAACARESVERRAKAKAAVEVELPATVTA